MNILRAVSIAFTALITAAYGGAQTGNPGQVNFSRLANPGLDSFTNSPTPAQQQWFQTNFTRMGVFSPYFDSRTSWYTNAQVYMDMYAISVGGAEAAQYPQYILHDANGNPLYIPWGCSNGTCPQYAADLANPGFRALWISEMQAILSQGNYEGLWIDDVNMNFSVSDGNGNFVAPIDDATGQPMTWTAWRAYVAQFLTQIRQAFPNREILHNSVWYAGPSPQLDLDPSIQAQIAAADIINIERGIGSDPGLTGGTGFWSLYSLFGYIDRVHQAGKNVVFEDYNVTDEPTQEYSLAGYFLLSSGKDYYGDTVTTPANWWSGFNVNLGAPLGPHTYNNGVYQRNFTQGMVLLGEPGLTTQTITLPGTFTNLSGTSVNSVTLTGSQGIVLTGTFPNQSAPALSLVTTSLPPATAGAAYNASLVAAGGSGAYSFSVSGAPSGLGISGANITGTPAGGTAGTYGNVLITVKDTSSGATAQRTLSLTVYSPLTLMTSSLPSGSIGAAYSANLAASGGSGIFSWSVANQPAGLAISGSTLSGTPTAPGTSSGVALTVTDSQTTLSAQKTFSITIAGAPAILTLTLPSGAVGSLYSAALTASGGFGTYTWSATGLPAGITVSGSSLTGTPTTAGTYSSVSVTATDPSTNLKAQKTFSLTIAGTPVILTSTLASGTVGTLYTSALAASGGSGTYTWSATGLPAGITVSGSSLTGTPTSAGTFSGVNITATDPSTGLQAQKTFSITIAGAPVIQTSTLASGTVGTLYTAALAASGGSGTYTWTASGLPAGITVSGSSLTGTPTTAGTFSSVSVTATDPSTGLKAQKTFSITIAGAPAILTSTLPSGTVGTLYTAALAASGGSGTYTWTASGLPAGITVSGSSLTGTPTTAGTFSSVNITATDPSTGLKTRKTVTITIRPRLHRSSLASGKVGSLYAAAVIASGGPHTGDNNIDIR